MAYRHIAVSCVSMLYTYRHCVGCSKNATLTIEHDDFQGYALQICAPNAAADIENAPYLRN